MLRALTLELLSRSTELLTPPQLQKALFICWNSAKNYVIVFKVGRGSHVANSFLLRLPQLTYETFFPRPSSVSIVSLVLEESYIHLSHLVFLICVNYAFFFRVFWVE